MHISLLANPSHLEAVNPVVCGKARAKQFYDNDVERSKTMPLRLHSYPHTLTHTHTQTHTLPHMSSVSVS